MRHKKSKNTNQLINPRMLFIGLFLFLTLGYLVNKKMHFLRFFQDVHASAYYEISPSMLPYAYSLLTRSGDHILENNFLDNTAPTYNDPYPELAYECSSLFQASQKLASTDSTRSANYLNHATRIADYLVTHKDDNQNGKVGWGLRYAWDAYQDGTINPADTEYAAQTGVVQNCLLDAYEVTHNQTYLDTTVQAQQTFVNLGTTAVNANCNNCWYYWYSANSNDFNKAFIKNTNVEMGMIDAQLGKITGDTAYINRARQVYNTEKYEIDYRKNFGYQGYSSSKANGPVENHIVAEIWQFDDLAHNLGATDHVVTLSAMNDAWWNCTSTNCSNGVTSPYAMNASCGEVHEFQANAPRCEQDITAFSSDTVSDIISAYGMYGLVKGLTPYYLSRGTIGQPSATPTPTDTPVTPTTTPIPPTDTPIPTATNTPIPTNTFTPTPTRDLVAPVVSITYPANNATVTRNKTLKITATASDNVRVSKVEFYVNGILKCRDTTSSYTCNWSVPSTRNAQYTIKAVATDSSQNTGMQQITVTAK